MQPENTNENVFCTLCINGTNYINSEIVEHAKKMLEVVLSNLILEEEHKHLICKSCYSKLLAAFNFKMMCMRTEDIILHVNSSKKPVVDLKEVYVKMNENVRLIDIKENQRICRLCFQLVTYRCVLFNAVDNNIINTHIPEVNIGATKDPVICRSCFDSLHTLGCFVKNCFEVQKKYKSADEQPCIKTEEVEVKLEDGHNVDKQFNIITEKTETKDGYDARGYKNIDNSTYIKSEEIEIKSEENSHYNDSFSHKLNEDIMEYIKNIEETKYEDTPRCETKILVNECETPLETDLKHKIVPELEFFSETQTYKCDNGHLRSHHLIHENPSEIQKFMCDACNYTTKYKTALKTHQLTHKDRFEIQMYKCDTCTYQTKYRSFLKNHQLTHKDPSEIQMYRCDQCSYESKRKGELKRHQITHKDPSEVQMYTCDTCSFETKFKCNLKMHLLTHKDPSEIQMYKCDLCSYTAKYKRHIKSHQVTHKNPSQIQMYKCDTCSFETKFRSNLKIHQVIHKDSSEIKMYKCDTCFHETKYKTHLKKHQLTHSLMYKCDECNYRSKCKGELKSHQLSHKDDF